MLFKINISGKGEKYKDYGREQKKEIRSQAKLK